VTTLTFCQSASSEVFRTNEVLKKNNLGIEIIASVLPNAKITKEEGKYELKSRLQSSYDLGINYLHSLNKSLLISTGLHFIIGKRNFFANIPSRDINNWDGRNIIEDKDLWGSFRIPLLIEKKLNYKKTSVISVKTGFNFRYSGLMQDESIGGAIIDSNNQVIDIFNAELLRRNNGKPWVTFLTGMSKSIILNNKNILSVGLQADVSTTYFLKGNYEITIPNQPITRGTYKINGTSLGLSVQYIFTGGNKQIIKPTKNKLPDTLSLSKQLKRESFLDKYVFKGNHIQFNFALLTTFKAQLKNFSGNHPIKTNATPGLLISFKYQKNFNNSYSLITGPEAILSGRNFIVSFNKNDFSPPLIKDYNFNGKDSYLADLILSLPVLLEKRWLYKNTKYLFANGGFQINAGLGADLDIFSFFAQNVNNDFYSVAEVTVYANNDAKPWISFPLNAGHAWLLKNNNVLQLAIISNISFTKYVNGTYQVTIPNKPVTEGKYSSTGSYIGLSLNYLFTNANYRIRKEYEQKKKS
jgi:hypothetical protein